MPKPFDATLKSLIRNHPADWLNHLGVPITAPPRVIDAELSVKSVAVLLRSNAVTAGLSDRVEYEGLKFRFELVRVWEQPAETFLNAGIGLLPLAVLARPPEGVTREQALPDQVSQLAEAFEGEPEP